MMSHLPCLYLVIIIFILNQWNGFFIKKPRVINFIFSDHFPFLVLLNKRKNKNMGNCVSKINKDYFFAFEEEMKNDILFSNGMKRPALDMVTRGKAYTGVHSIKKFSIKITLTP